MARAPRRTTTESSRAGGAAGGGGGKRPKTSVDPDGLPRGGRAGAGRAGTPGTPGGSLETRLRTDATHAATVSCIWPQCLKKCRQECRRVGRPARCQPQRRPEASAPVIICHCMIMGRISCALSPTALST